MCYHPLVLQTTAIVNSCRRDLDLQNSGPLAKSLIHAAGPALQADCLQYTHSHGPVEIGDFCSTAGHNLRAKRIYHSVVPTFIGTTVPFVDDGGQVCTCGSTVYFSCRLFHVFPIFVDLWAFLVPQCVVR